MESLNTLQPFSSPEFCNLPQPLKTPMMACQKRGRKALDSTLVLSEFYGRSQKGPPRREYLRCCIIRKMLKFIRQYLDSKLLYSYNPYFQQLITIIECNRHIVEILTARENLPGIENGTNRKYKTYNNKFCQEFLGNELMRYIFQLYVEYLFNYNSFNKLRNAISVSCCKGECKDVIQCRLKYEKIKFIILETF